MTNDIFMLGYDYSLFCSDNLKVPLYVNLGHTIIVGGSNAGKSTALIYWLYKMRHIPNVYYIADGKGSGEFNGISRYYADLDGCYALIKEFYAEFLRTPEGGDGVNKILLIDEIAGLLAHLSMNKETRGQAEEIRNILSVCLMAGRSKRIFIFLAMQRYSATNIFPSASGAVDNFHCYIGLSHLTVDSRKSLFAGEHLENEEELYFTQGRGLVLVSGCKLQALIIPFVSKKKLLSLLNEKS